MINEICISIEHYFKMKKTILHQKKIINRLSRKIQRLKRISLTNGEITSILFAIDLVIQNFGENKRLEKIYDRLYCYKKEYLNDKKKF